MSGFPYPRPLAARRNLMALFFSPFGRIGRVTYLLLMPLVLAGCLVLFIVGMFTSEHGLFYSDWQIFGPALFLLITAGGSLILRRLHDVGLPGFFSLLGLLPRAGWLAATPWLDVMHNSTANDIFIVLILAD